MLHKKCSKQSYHLIKNEIKNKVNETMDVLIFDATTKFHEEPSVSRNDKLFPLTPDSQSLQAPGNKGILCSTTANCYFHVKVLKNTMRGIKGHTTVKIIGYSANLKKISREIWNMKD